MGEMNHYIPRLGCCVTNETIGFSLYAKDINNIILKLYRFIDDVLPVRCIELKRGEHTIGDIFFYQYNENYNIQGYTWQIRNEIGEEGILLVDPYAKDLYEIEPNKYRNCVVRLEPITHTKPYIPWDETIIYELHVGNFTRSHTSGIELNARGTFKGLEAKLDYLKELGVTSIELLPVFKWHPYTINNKHPKTGNILRDEWGYNTIGFFALQRSYVVEDTIEEFRNLVGAIHEKGMEVILDVVYNHTGEGGSDGTVFHFKALADEVYYKKADGNYLNCTGTGNVLNNTHIVVKDLILDSLRYWVTCFDVDGFRFDLAPILQQDERGEWTDGGLLTDIANDPLLSSVKLISEGWDAKGSYNVGQIPEPFREWSDFYRDTVRKVVRGDMGTVGDLARCLLGQDIYFVDNRKKSYHSIHFVTAHDGFTMWDLLSYNKKNNILNGEGNRDGHNSNYSYNCGMEGETNHEGINRLRLRKMKNFFTLVAMSVGVPMLLMGDERARTQYGNNNAFCQNDEDYWVQWNENEKTIELVDFVKKIFQLRKKMKWFKEKVEKKITWHGVKCFEPDWSYHSQSLAWEIEAEEEVYYIVMNNFSEKLFFELPVSSKGWKVLVDTYEGKNEESIFKENVEVYSNSMSIYKKL